MKFIGIGGGSGSGKSTVSFAIVDSNPQNFEVLQLDDYQKPSDAADLPMIEDMINWDHPDVIDWDKLISDLDALKNDQAVTIKSWAHRSNPEYANHRKMIDREIEPKPILIVEGYLALYNPILNEFYDYKIYLDTDETTRNSRRDKDEVINETKYVEKVLRPMHTKYVEPTKNNADIVIDVTELTADQVCQQILEKITTK